jgi:hypothetical protein
LEPKKIDENYEGPKMLALVFALKAPVRVLQFIMIILCFSIAKIKRRKTMFFWQIFPLGQYFSICKDEQQNNLFSNNFNAFFSLLE